MVGKCVTKEIPKGCLKKNRNVGHCPKRWEGVQTGSQIFHIVQMGHSWVGGMGPDGNVPNAAHNILFKRRLTTNM